MTDPVFKVTEHGISAPTFPEVLEYFQSEARRIFGDDINISEDTHDGQLISVVAAALHDVNGQAIETFNAYNPQTAYGVALDSAVKTNGIKRRDATHSVVDVRIVGQAGTVIRNGEAKDGFGNTWLLPEVVTIPIAGEIVVTATAKTEGAITADIGSVSEIATPTRGWQSITNISKASVGVPTESDAELRDKQSRSTMNPSVSLWDGLVDSVSTLNGVIRVSGINNDTTTESEEGVPAHSCAIVVDGGDAVEIAETIYRVKGQGVGTYGTITETIVDRFGYSIPVKFSRPTTVPIYVSVTIVPKLNYTEDSVLRMKERISAYINSLDIGQSVDFVRLIASTVQSGGLLDEEYSVESVTIGKSASALYSQGVSIDWNESAHTDSDHIEIVGAV